MQQFLVNDYEELKAVKKGLETEHSAKPSVTLLYRGQTQEYPRLLPSILRSDPNSDLIANWAQAIEYLMVTLHKEGLLHHSQNASPEINSLIAAMLIQHYGYVSPFLDLTADINTALWFAHHQCEALPFFAEDVDGITAVENCVKRYKHTYRYPNYIYVFAGEAVTPNTSPQMYDLVDFSKLVTIEETRISQQAAWGLFFDPPEEGDDVDALEVAVAEIEIAFDYEDVPDEHRARVTDLFPGYEEDAVFKAILSIPFVGSLPIIDIVDRPFLLPLYFEEEYNEDQIGDEIAQMHSDICQIPRFTFPYYKHIRLFLADGDPLPILYGCKTRYHYDDLRVFKLAVTLPTINRSILHSSYAYTLQGDFLQVFYSIATDWKDISLLFEFSDIDFLGAPSEITKSGVLFLCGVWGQYSAGRIAVRGLYAGQEMKAGSFGDYALTPTFVWDVSKGRKHWQLVKALVRSSYETENPVELDSIPEKARAQNLANHWFNITTLMATGHLMIHSRMSSIDAASRMLICKTLSDADTDEWERWRQIHDRIPNYLYLTYGDLYAGAHMPEDLDIEDGVHKTI